MLECGFFCFVPFSVFSPESNLIALLLTKLSRTRQHSLKQKTYTKKKNEQTKIIGTMSKPWWFQTTWQPFSICWETEEKQILSKQTETKEKKKKKTAKHTQQIPVLLQRWAAKQTWEQRKSKATREPNLDNLLFLGHSFLFSFFSEKKMLEEQTLKKELVSLTFANQMNNNKTRKLGFVFLCFAANTQNTTYGTTRTT